jgi:hypothetical protein
MGTHNGSIEEVPQVKQRKTAMGGWRPKTIADPALWVTLLVSASVAFAGNEAVLRSARTDVGIAQVGIGTALLGVALAGLAVLVAFLDEEYIRLLEQVSPGIDADLWPFKYTALIAAVCAAFGMALLIIGNPPAPVFRVVLWLSLWSFSYLLWAFLDLVKFVTEHAKTRVRQIQKKHDK